MKKLSLAVETLRMLTPELAEAVVGGNYSSVNPTVIVGKCTGQDNGNRPQ